MLSGSEVSTGFIDAPVQPFCARQIASPGVNTSIALGIL